MKRCAACQHGKYAMTGGGHCSKCNRYIHGILCAPTCSCRTTPTVTPTR